MAREPQPYMQNRELSWLTFNERVLEEARDPSNPLAERLKFVSIFTSNLDEFFMIRVGSLYDMAVMGDDQVDSRTGLLPSQQLEAIYRRAVLLMEQRDQVYAQLQTQLQAYGVCEVSPGQLAGKDKDFLKTYFKTQLLPILSPQIVDINHPFPHLQNKSVYVVARLHGKDRSLFGIVPVPPSAPEVVYLPGEGLRYVRTEQLLLDNLKRVFDPYGVAEKNCVCVTRNADIAPQDEGFDVDDDFRCQMQKLLHKRKRMAVVRLECAAPPSEARLSLQALPRRPRPDLPLPGSHAHGVCPPHAEKAAGTPPQCAALPALLPPDAPQAQAGDLSPPGPAPGSASQLPF